MQLKKKNLLKYIYLVLDFLDAGIYRYTIPQVGMGQ